MCIRKTDRLSILQASESNIVFWRKKFIIQDPVSCRRKRNKKRETCRTLGRIMALAGYITETFVLCIRCFYVSKSKTKYKKEKVISMRYFQNAIYLAIENTNNYCEEICSFCRKEAKQINETLTNETVKLFVSFARSVVILDWFFVGYNAILFRIHLSSKTINNKSYQGNNWKHFKENFKRDDKSIMLKARYFCLITNTHPFHLKKWILKL